MSDPDGNDGLLPGRVGNRTPVSDADSGRARPADEAKGPNDGTVPGKRRRKRRRGRGIRGKKPESASVQKPQNNEKATTTGGTNKPEQGRAITERVAAPSHTINGHGTASAVGPATGVREPSDAHVRHDGANKHDGAKTRSGKWNGQHHKLKPNHRQGHRHRYPIRRDTRELYAALDLGTNNCRLLIAEPRGKGFKVVDAFSRIVRLGEGVSQNGSLRVDAMERAIDALQVCRRKLDYRKVKKVRLVATEACRTAENGQLFLDRVRDEANLDLEVLSRGGEAKLAVMGCSPLIDHRDDGALLFDIGGGSSEIAWIDLKKRHNDRSRCVTDCILNWTSLPVGVVSLSEKFGGVDVTPDVFEDMVSYVDDLLDEAGKWGLLANAISSGRAHFIGTSGTVTTIAGVHLELDRYDRRQVDGIWLNEGKIDKVMKLMRAMTYPERVDNACIGRDRADLVLGGCAILEAIRRRWPCKRLRVADRGLREGILLELMTADGVWNRDRRNTNSNRLNKT